MVFKNDDNQIRSGWKILITFIVFLLFTLVATLLVSVIYGIVKVYTNKNGIQDITSYILSIASDKTYIFLISLSQCLAMIFSVVLFWKVFEKKPIRYMGLINIKSSYRDLFIGLTFGSISMILVFIILLGTQSVSMVNLFSNPNLSRWIFIDLILFIFVGINEEMFARGYCMSVLKQTRNKYVIVIVSSLIFSLMHSFNPYMSVLSYINLFLVGILFSYMYIKARNIWLPIGYHVTWNYFQGDIFGFQVSGTEVNGMYNVKAVGNDLITGGSFGPEGGLVVTLIVLLGLVFLWKFYNKSNDENVDFLR